MKNWKRYLRVLILLAAMSSAHAAFGQSQQPPTNSAQSSPNSLTHVSKSEPPAVAGGLTRSKGKSEVSTADLQPVATAPGSDLIAACSATADELKASRELIEALGRENAALTSRLATEKQTTQLLAELNETRKSESDALRVAVAAKNETIAAKDAVIANQDKLIETLKRKKSSPWRRIGDVLVGVGIGLVLK